MFENVKFNFSYNSVKRNFSKVSEIDNVEEVYYRENKLVVVVKDEEIKEQIYDIITTLKNRGEIFSTEAISKKITFKVCKYVSDKQNKIQMFYIDINFEGRWNEVSELEKLMELTTLIANMEEKGYILDNKRFENDKVKAISTFLSLFNLNDENTDSSKEYLIKYIHYVLSNGQELAQYYENVVNDTIVKVSNFPYTLPIIKMCYNYFINNAKYTAEEIYSLLKSEEYNQTYSLEGWNYLITGKNLLMSKYVATNSNSDYTIYNGNIKIYNNMPEEFGEFLEYYDESRKKVYPVRTLEKVIIDFGGNVIGYKFNKEREQSIQRMLDVKLKNQHEIFNFIADITTMLQKNSELTSNSRFCKCNNDFSVEEDIVYYMDNLWITEIEKVYNFFTNDEHKLNSKIISLFFKIYLRYLNEKYGEMNDEKQFISKTEVRFLNPLLAENLINYALGKQVNYELAEEFLQLVIEYSMLKYSYDPKFEYDPTSVPFLFEYEAEEKYGIKLENGMNYKLPDGRTLVTFKRKRKISTFKSENDSKEKDLYSYMRYIEDDNVKIVRVSEIIYSKSMNNENMYKLAGYVTQRFEGSRLSTDTLLKLNNKDLLRVMTYLFSKFNSYYYIPWNNIFMDDNFTFYINTLDEDFEVKKCDYRFSKWIVDYLVQKGYNPNAFIEDIHFDYEKGMLKKAENMDAYCKEHGIYYKSKNKMCPACLKSMYIVQDNFEESYSELFEDVYAKHYRVDDNYSLKVYKTEYMRSATDLEQNIDNIVSARLNSELPHGYYLKNHTSFKQIQFIQECFIPYKKAVNANNEFIGYIYKYEASNEDTNSCIDISDLHKLKNLPRLKSMIRLILQIKELTDNKLGFTLNPFTYVFLIKNYKKQVQICNIEFLERKENVEQTLKWTYEYVLRILDLDDSIKLNTPKDSTNLEALLEELQNLSEELTKYCPIHKIYYKNEKIFCPKCVDKSIIKDIKIENADLEDITNQKEEGKGGEAIVYSYGKKEVVKIFKEEEVDYDYKNMILSRILSRKNILEDLNKKAYKYFFVIPKKLLIDSKTQRILGYTMKKVKGMPISVLRDKDKVKELGLTMRDVLEILITVGNGIEALHTEANIFIGDLNNKNILFDVQKNVYFLDFDGMGIDDISPMFFTDGFIDPISKKNRNVNMKDDWYSFAIQAFYYLTFTHPFNGIYNDGGREMPLEIPEKMELRISLLGKHGMKPPAIAKPWNWMDNELKKVFLNIFEGDNRESIVPYLIKQYKHLYKMEPFSILDGSIKVNSKFIATEVKLFSGDVVRVINHYSAICLKDNYYVSILTSNKNEKQQYDIDFPECMEINNILLVQSAFINPIAVAVYTNKVIAIDLKENTQIYSEEILELKDVCVNDDTLYCSGILNDEDVIFQRTFMPYGEIKKEKIKFLGDKQTKSFLTQLNSKFVIVKEASENTDEVYCNSEKLCNIACNNQNANYNIIYDDTNKLWLVINSEGNGIIIKASNGKYDEFNISNEVNDINIKNIKFNKGNIYIPSQDFLYIVKVKDQLETKKMECTKIMTPDSKLYDINTKGFSVITNNVLYEVRKG